MDDIVIVSQGENPYHTTINALQQYRLPNLRGKKVLLKPNAARLALPGQGITTHPLVVKAALDYLREVGIDDVAIGESCIFGVDAHEAFQRTGMREISENGKVPLINMDQCNSMEVTIRKGRILRKIRVPTILKAFSFIISIPVMKTHMHTRVTLSIKNMKGLLWRREKARFHQLRCNPRLMQGYKELDMAISDMASVLFPHLAIIDGTVGMEGMGPAYGKKKATGVIVVGANALSADAVASRIMGFDPELIPHLKLSALKGLGEIKTQNILVKPRDYLKWKSPFEPPPSRFSIPFRDVLVHDEGSCSACLSTLIILLQNHYSKLGGFRLQDGNIHIGMGKNLEACPKGTILIGNCTTKVRKNKIFVQGCPPVASEILRTLSIHRTALKENEDPLKDDKK